MCPAYPDSATVSLSPVSGRAESCLPPFYSSIAGRDSGRLGLELAPTELQLRNLPYFTFLTLVMAPQCPGLKTDSLLSRPQSPTGPDL